jgi:GMP synthase-like glutamine amidotransferase
MHVHYLQHVPFEGLGFIEDWLKTNGHSISSTPLYEQPAGMPSPDAFDALVIMGGPMNVNEEDKYPWLAAEKAMIRESIAAGKKILGICLGAQLIAAAAGGQVFPHTVKEIGWFPVNFKPGMADWLHRDITAEQTFFHWHGDTYTLPDGFINHASTEACSQQLYTCGDNIMGIQFHPEMTAAGVQALVKNDGAELQEKPFIQTEQTILSTRQHFEQAHALMAILLDRLFNRI